MTRTPPIRFWSLGVICVLAGVLAVMPLSLLRGATGKAPALGALRSPVRTMMHIQQDYTDEELADFARKYDHITLSRKATWRAAFLKSVNPGVKVLVYHMVPGVQPKPGDWLWEEINRHESWFVHDVSGKRIRWVQEGWYLLNPASAGYQQFVAMFILDYATQYQFDGAWLDRAGFELKGRPDSEWSSPIPPAKVNSWFDDMTAFLASVKAMVGPLSLIYNTMEANPFGYAKQPDDEHLAQVDGGMMEGFAHSDHADGKTYQKRETWEFQVGRAGDMVAADKIFWMQPGADANLTTQAQLVQITNYALATYLLFADGRDAYMTFVYDTHTQPDDTTYLQGYTAPIGAPLGPWFLDAGVFRRDFTNGRVLVNPDDDRTFTIDLGAIFRQVDAMTGDRLSVSSLILKPKRGAALLLPLP